MRSWWEIVPVGAAALTAEFGTHPTTAGPTPEPELTESPVSP